MSERPVTGQTAAKAEASGPPPARRRSRFWHWRHSRPFWGGVWSLLGGLIVLAGPALAVKLIMVAGQIIWLGILVGLLIAVCGIFLWIEVGLRRVISALIILLALVSLITSDLGGFFIGMLLSLLGGSMGMAWTPKQRPQAAPASPPAPLLDRVGQRPRTLDEASTAPPA